jgi:multidrug efflux pump subunit AcrA (membrane-fusion protein)
VDLIGELEVRVPAEEAGVLVKVNVTEGNEVKAFKKRIFTTSKEAAKVGKEVDPLVQIDVSLPWRQRDVAAREYEKAKAEAENDVNTRYSKAASQVSYFAWQKVVDANRNVRGAVSEIEEKRLELDYQASKLKIEQSDHERMLATKTAMVKREEYYAADDAIERRRIDSPIDGVVTDVYVHEGEWVKPGDPVLRIVNLKRLRVKGFLKRADHDPNDVDGKTVSVKAYLDGGKMETFPGKITFISQEILDGESYAVWAEVDNRKPEGGKYYLLQPGMTVDLEIEK